jgi:AbrB family looped-hinge helix DNA binding protein
MTIAKVNGEGQITIPDSIIADLNICSGDGIKFVKIKEGHYEITIIPKEGSGLEGTRKLSALEMQQADDARAEDY